MRHYLTPLVLISALLAAPAGAEVLLIDAVKQAEGQQVPRAGITMDSVRSQFGDPSSTEGPVGEPPITQWVYDGFTVYFEFDRVIHAVVHRDSESVPAQP